MSISQRASASVHPPTTPTPSVRMFADQEIEKALDWLRDSATAIGDTRARLIKAGHMIKHAEALGFLASTHKTVDAKKADARTTAEYLKWVEEESAAAGEYEMMKALREAAAMKIEAWRSEQANFRAMKI